MSCRRHHLTIDDYPPSRNRASVTAICAPPRYRRRKIPPKREDFAFSSSTSTPCFQWNCECRLRRPPEWYLVIKKTKHRPKGPKQYHDSYVTLVILFADFYYLNKLSWYIRQDAWQIDNDGIATQTKRLQPKKSWGWEKWIVHVTKKNKKFNKVNAFTNR